MIFNYEKPTENLSFSDLFKELYDHSYTEKERAEIRLIERYWKVLPYKLIRKYNDVKSIAKERGSAEFRSTISGANHFLKALPKAKGWSGGYVRVPIVVE